VISAINIMFPLYLSLALKAVKLETAHPGRTRYLVVVNISTRLSQNNEESCILGIDCNEETTVGLVFPVWADTRIILDGDGYVMVLIMIYLSC